MAFLDNLFKSPQQKEAELKNYYQWAYPYGDEHKQKIEELIKNFIPNEKLEYAVFSYLVARQELAPSVYEGPFQVLEEEFAGAAKRLKKQYYYKSYKDVHKYIALVEADLLIKADLNYPSLEQLEKRAEQIKAIISKK